MNRTFLAALAGVGVLGGVGTAAAQSVTAVEGVGYPLSESMVFHPTLGAEAGFTDNVFYADDDRKASGILRLVVEAAIASKDPVAEEEDPFAEEAEPTESAAQKVQFRAGGRLAYQEYLSPDATARSQRDLAADLNGHLVVLPEGTFSFNADDRFVRDTRPTNFESFADTSRIHNLLTLGLKYQPGGRTLNVGAYYENVIDFFEDTDQRFANKMINTIHARSEWAFFPYSKAYVDLSYGFISSMGEAQGLSKRGANPFRGGLGVATSITEIFTVKAHLGWTYASYDGGATYNSPIMGLELGYRYSPLGRFVVGYEWDYRDSVNADYFRDHALRAQVDHQIGARIIGAVTADVRFRAYRGVPMEIDPDTNRDDLIFAVGANVQYVLRDWLAIVGLWRTEVDQTDDLSMFGGQPEDPSYNRTEITVGVRAAL